MPFETAGHCVRNGLAPSLTTSHAGSLITQIGVIKSGCDGSARFYHPRTQERTRTMPLLQILRPALPILIGASLMLSLSMGLRQSLGIFMQPLTHDIGISVSDFTLAIAVQNLAWGFLQPLARAFTVRLVLRAIMTASAVLYIACLSLMAAAPGFLSIMLGAGVLIGMSLACT